LRVLHKKGNEPYQQHFALEKVGASHLLRKSCQQRVLTTLSHIKSELIV